MSFTEHPQVVQPFIADGIVEAVQTASTVMRQDHIKGAYWTNLHMAAPEKAADLNLRDHFIDTIRSSEEDAIMGLQPKSASALICLPSKKDPEGALDVRMGYAENAPSAIPYLDKTRLACLEALTSLFSHVTLTIHLEQENYGKPHCDTDPKIETPDPTTLFEGRHIRMLIPRDIRGTEVYDADHKALLLSRRPMLGHFNKLSEPWTMVAGNALFFGGLGWGEDKALVHGSPNFTLAKDDHPRTLDVYDCIAQ